MKYQVVAQEAALVSNMESEKRSRLVGFMGWVRSGLRNEVMRGHRFCG